MDHVYSLVYIYFFKTIWDIAWVRMSLYQCTQAVLAEDLTVFKLLWCSLPLILLSFNIISYKQKYFNINLVVFQEAQPVLIIKITKWKGVNMITCLFSCPDEGKKTGATAVQVFILYIFLLVSLASLCSSGITSLISPSYNERVLYDSFPCNSLNPGW